MRFESFGEYLLAIKKASDSDGKIVDKRLKRKKQIMKSCPECSLIRKVIISLPFYKPIRKLYYCNKCKSFWGFN